MPSVEDILQEREQRQTYWSEPHIRWNDLNQAYLGEYQKLWPAEFRRGEAPKVANWIKLSWDRYKMMVGKTPTDHINPSRTSRGAQREADKVEKILRFYDESSGMTQLMRWYAFYLVGFGASCIGVMPDGNLKGPRFFVKDPRSVLPAPGAGSISTTSASFGMLTKPTMTAMSLHSVIFNETVTGSYLLSQYKHLEGIVRPLLNGENLNTPQSMVTWMDDDYLCVIVNGKKILEVDHEFGFVPVRFTTVHAPEQLGGQSLFEQNIGLVLAYLRTLNQKLTYNDNIVWPWLMIRGLADIDKVDRVINIMDRDGDAKFLTPGTEIQVERDLDVLDRLIRVMNHDSEAMQGEAAGSIVTGAGQRELNRDIRQVVTDYWDLMTPDIEFVKAAALIIDETMYGSMEKTMYGRVKGEPFEETYIPSKDINGNHNVTIDFGLGLGGLEGFTELMQISAQGMIDEQSVMEQQPWIRSVSDTKRKVMMDRLERLIFEAVGGGAPPEVINHLSAWRMEIDKSKDPWKWISKNPFPQPPEPSLGELGAPPGGPGGVIPGQEAAPQPPQVPPIAQPPSPSQLLSLGQGRPGSRPGGQ